MRCPSPVRVHRHPATTDDGVLHEVAVRPDPTGEERAAVHIDIDPRGLRCTLPWVAAPHDSPGAMRCPAA